MQVEELFSTIGQTTSAADIGRQAHGADVPVDKNIDKTAETDRTDGGLKEKLSRKELEEVVKNLSEFTGWGNFNIDFSLDEKTNSMIIKIVDRESGETLRQIPSEQLLNLKGHIREVLGLVFDHMA